MQAHGVGQLQARKPRVHCGGGGRVEHVSRDVDALCLGSDTSPSLRRCLFFVSGEVNVLWCDMAAVGDAIWKACVMSLGLVCAQHVDGWLLSVHHVRDFLFHATRCREHNMSGVGRRWWSLWCIVHVGDGLSAPCRELDAMLAGWKRLVHPSYPVNMSLHACPKIA